MPTSESPTSLPFTTLPSLLATTALLAPFIIIFCRSPTTTAPPPSPRTRQRQAHVHAFLRVHSAAYALFSLALLLALLGSYAHNAIYHGGNAVEGQEWRWWWAELSAPRRVGYVYHLTKVYEYMDVVLLVCAGKAGAIGRHMTVHHLTTPYWTFWRVIRGWDRDGNGDDGRLWDEWRVFAACNAAHHVIMYAYYSERADVQWLRAVLPWTGAGQLLAGIGVDGWRLWQGWGLMGREHRQGRMVAVGLLVVYGWLYWGEVQEASKRRRRESRRREEGRRDEDAGGGSEVG